MRIGDFVFAMTVARTARGGQTNGAAMRADAQLYREIYAFAEREEKKLDNERAEAEARAENERRAKAGPPA